MNKELSEIKNMQDFKIYLNYPRIPEGRDGAGLFERMKFNTCKTNSNDMISWFKKDNEPELYLIRVSKECIEHIEKPRFGFGGLPMMCEDLKFVKSVNSGFTKDGHKLVSIQILKPGELSEQSEYRNSHPTKDEVYQQLREDEYNSHSNYERNDTEEDWQNNPEEDFKWGGLDGDEAHDAMWNCD